jgi:uncharacterized protein
MKTVAVIGASHDRAKFGNKAVRAFRDAGFAVYPVNPHEVSVEGLSAYHSVRDLPVRPEMITVYVPPKVLMQLLPEIAAVGCDELWFNPGTDSDEVLLEAQRLGLKPICGCSILALGLSPSKY